MTVMDDDFDPIGDLIDDLMADLKAYEAKVRKDGRVLHHPKTGVAYNHPLLAEIRQCRALLAKLQAGMN
jgi:hypothetical protein